MKHLDSVDQPIFRPELTHFLEEEMDQNILSSGVSSIHELIGDDDQIKPKRTLKKVDAELHKKLLAMITKTDQNKF